MSFGKGHGAQVLPSQRQIKAPRWDSSLLAPSTCQLGVSLVSPTKAIRDEYTPSEHRPRKITQQEEGRSVALES